MSEPTASVGRFQPVVVDCYVEGRCPCGRRVCLQADAGSPLGDPYHCECGRVLAIGVIVVRARESNGQEGEC